MNLHGIVSGAIAAVNPMTMGTVMVSTGYTTAANGSRTPTYAAPQTVPMQIQALTTHDIMHVDALNVAGSTHTIYLNGRLDSLVRSQNKGGDIIIFGGQTWLVTALLEDFPDWCKVAVTLQNNG